jgi:hypothetical protein
MKNTLLVILLLVASNLGAQITFDSKKVHSIYYGEKHLINFKSNSTARIYKTRISMAYRECGVNFAGHYSFIYWGCGSPCASCVIVDVRTGRVYSGPDSAFGYTFRKDSRLLIVNSEQVDKDLTGAPYSELYPEERWVWQERLKRFIKLQ